MSLDNTEEIKRLEHIKSQIELALVMLREGNYLMAYGNFPNRELYFRENERGEEMLIGDYRITKR